MLVRAARLRRAVDGIGGVDRDRVLVDVILVHVVEMPVVQVIDVAGMAHHRMSAVGTVLVSVVRVMLLVAGGHGVHSFSCAFLAHSLIHHSYEC